MSKKQFDHYLSEILYEAADHANEQLIHEDYLIDYKKRDHSKSIEKSTWLAVRTSYYIALAIGYDESGELSGGYKAVPTELIFDGKGDLLVEEDQKNLIYSAMVALIVNNPDDSELITLFVRTFYWGHKAKKPY